jgi:hypothetical protein
MHSISDLRDRLNTDDHRLWLLIGLCVAVILTIEVVEEAVEGVWPHQRRMSGMDIGQQRAHQIWALVALLVLPAALLATMNVGMMVWKDTPTTDGIRTGAALLAIGWGSFLLANIDRLGLRSLVSRAGPVLPVTLAIILVIAIALLLTAFLDVRPDMQTIRDAIPGLKSSD